MRSTTYPRMLADCVLLRPRHRASRHAHASICGADANGVQCAGTVAGRREARFADADCTMRGRPVV